MSLATPSPSTTLSINRVAPTCAAMATTEIYTLSLHDALPISSETPIARAHSSSSAATRSMCARRSGVATAQGGKLTAWHPVGVSRL